MDLISHDTIVVPFGRLFLGALREDDGRRNDEIMDR